MAFQTPGTSNPFGSFGSTSSAAPASNIFGTPSTSTSGAPAASGTNIFGSTSSAPAGGTGAFGSSSAAPAAPTSAFGAFGSTSTSGAGFGAASTSQPSTGLFGASAAPASQPAPAGSNIFGASSAAPAASGAPTTNIFGSSAPASSNAFGASTSAFGSSTNAFGSPASTNTSGAGGLFGQKPAAPTIFGASTAGTAGGFGASTTGTGFGSAGGAFGSSTFGGGQPQPNNTLGQSAAAGGQNLLKTSRFNDLSPEIKQQIEQIDNYIQQESAVGDELKAREFGTLISEGKTRLRDVSTDFTALSTQLSASSSSLSALRSSLDSLTRSFLRASALVDAYRSQPSSSLPPSSNLALTTSSQPGAQGQDREALVQRAQRLAKFPFEYFDEKTREMEARLRRCQEGMESVAGMIKGWNDRANPAAIVPALRAQHSTFMSLASSVASLDVQLKALKEDYRDLWRRQMGGTVRDPFEEAFLEQTGVDTAVQGMRL